MRKVFIKGRKWRNNRIHYFLFFTFRKFLEAILNFEGLIIYSTTPKDEIEICEIAKKFNLTFDDALHYYVARQFNLTLVSFDKDFDRTDIKRKEPKEII